MPSRKRAQKTFSDSFNELEAIVRELEKSADVDTAIETFENGLRCAEELKRRLQNVEQRVEKLRRRYDVLSQEE